MFVHILIPKTVVVIIQTTRVVVTPLAWKLLHRFALSECIPESIRHLQLYSLRFRFTASQPRRPRLEYATL